MVCIKSQKLEVDTRNINQNARLAIRDVMDAIVELVTNADDRYQILGRAGKIEIEIERRHTPSRCVLRVRDFADGMTASTMDNKIARIGGRVSGMERGLAVRGTNSRGAKDVAALGPVTFESIAEDGMHHRSRITEFWDYNLFQSTRPTPQIRKRIGIPEGTGTLVEIEIDPNHSVPRHETLLQKLRTLVSLRDILSDPNREVVLVDASSGRRDRIEALVSRGEKKVEVEFEVPGYPGATASLVIKRAYSAFDRASPKFRRGGILVKSRRAIHEATLFDAALERDPHAQWFFGRLECPAIDDLLNQFDDRFAQREAPLPANPVPIIDPSRKGGLTPDHPFVEKLFAEAKKRLLPFVEEERKRQEGERAKVESDRTRKRLDALERAATQFLQENREEEEPSRDPTGAVTGSRFRENGYSLSPPFAQMVKGHSQVFSLSVLSQSFPEIQEGETVRVECLTDEISADRPVCTLEPHPNQEGVLRATWKVTAEKATSATGLRVRCGSILAEATIEVLETEADRYAYVKELCFERKKYTVRFVEGRKTRKKLRLLAPLETAPWPTPVVVACSGREFIVVGETILRPDKNRGVAIGEITIVATRPDAETKVIATLEERKAETVISALPPTGAALKIKIEDISLGNQRYRWRQNVLEIAARHPSLSRYLGSKDDGFPGQEHRHFRLLIAEIVADAVCARLVSLNVEANPEEYEDADWDQYYAEYTRQMTRFLPVAHKLQCPDAEVAGTS